jgi:muramoyltetrapeptide carboxypeptidase
MLLLFKCRCKERNSVYSLVDYHPQIAYASFRVPKIPQITGISQIGLKCLQNGPASEYFVFQINQNMNRKQFVQAMGLLLAPVFNLTASRHKATAATNTCTQPPLLQPGDVIGITSPSAAVSPEDIAPALQVLQSWGYRPKIGTAIGRRDCSLGGTDFERAADLQQMLYDPGIKAIWCARGGYGLVRIIDMLDWTRFLRHPKWIIGFSDITVLHNRLHREGIASVHGKMLTSFPGKWAAASSLQMDTVLYVKHMLEGRKLSYTAQPHPQNKWGEATGLLVGGNLKMLETQAGTSSDLNTQGKILFVEDVGEYSYSIDRMFCNLKRTGKLNNLAGLVVGGFGLRADDEDKGFGRTVQDIVLEKTGNYNYPVCFDFGVGHQPANWPLKCGAMHRLSVGAGSVMLEEVGV